MSTPYLQFSRAEIKRHEGWIWVESDGWPLFPPKPFDLESAFNGYPVKKVWSDFEDWRSPPGFEKEFLDHQYLFQPKSFLQMKGGHWETFRKNTRKWPKKNTKPGYYTTEPPNDTEIGVLLANWMEKRMNSIEDADIIVNFTLTPHSEIKRKYLYDINNQLVGINIWDENWCYINFRFCLTADEPWLDEYLRYLFYIDPIILNTCKLVNDGGSLGNPGLERFKDKMNPYSKIKVHSWKKKKDYYPEIFNGK